MSSETITHEKLLMLDALTYYEEFSDMTGEDNSGYGTVEKFISNCKNYKTCFYKKFLNYTDKKLGMHKIIDFVENDDELKKLVIVYPNCEDSSTSSVCLVNPDTADVYVIYGGNYVEGSYESTDSEEQPITLTTWVNNVIGASVVHTEEQDGAMMFYDKAISKARQYLSVYKDEIYNQKDENGKYVMDLNITVSGHSTAGNHAQFVTTTYKRYKEGQYNDSSDIEMQYDENNDIDKCVTFDSQGFSSKFINEYETEINERANKITEYFPTVSYVGSLMHSIKGIEKKYIDVGTPDTFLIGYHMPSQMLDDKGNFKKEGEPEFVFQMLKILTTEVIENAVEYSFIDVDRATKAVGSAIYELTEGNPGKALKEVFSDKDAARVFAMTTNIETTH